MSRPVLCLLTCIFVTASFVDQRVDTYTLSGDYNDYNDEQRRAVGEEDDDKMNLPMNLLDFYRSYLDNNRNSENRRNTQADELENWTGRWMPDRLGDPTPPPKVFSQSMRGYHESGTESLHDATMGNSSPGCDDAKVNLTVDWDHSPTVYTCYGHRIVPSKTRPHFYCEYVPQAYKAVHKCMNETIEYDIDIPLYGTHRPLWPVYGEYKYLPKQRWLHSLEHGAIVMLYHPCANPLEVQHLKNLVSRCLWRHIITPCNDLDEDQPLALLSWGCKLTMSYVNPALVVSFIQEKALRGPEQISEDGQFQDRLLKPATVLTDPIDSVLCPNIY